jgi:hypothetical protein
VTPLVREAVVGVVVAEVVQVALQEEVIDLLVALHT